MTEKVIENDEIIKLILARQKISYLESLLNKNFIKSILENDINNTSKNYILDDLLEYLGCGNAIISETKPGPYPVISNVKTNNGEATKSNSYCFDGSVLYTIGRSNYTCFIQHGKINTVKDVFVFKPRKKYNDELLKNTINESLSKSKNSKTIAINDLRNIKINITYDIFLDNSIKVKYMKEYIDKIYENLEDSLKEYYKNHSIENIDIIKFSDAFNFKTNINENKKINKPLISFYDNEFHIEIINNSVNKNYIYMYPKVDYINIEKTKILMNEFIKFKKNINNENIKELLVPIYFESD